jgi:hypothetical protein
MAWHFNEADSRTFGNAFFKSGQKQALADGYLRSQDYQYPTFKIEFGLIPIMFLLE